MSSDGRFWPGLNRYLPVLGFGGWQIAGPHDVGGRPNGWGEISESHAIDLVSLALENGIRFFDTAQGYGDGRGEMVLGRGLAAGRGGGEAIVCTKLPLPAGMETAPAAEILPWLTAALDRSRTRLGRDVIDVLLLHNPPDSLEIEPFRAAFEALAAGGAIRTYGVSARSLAGARHFVDAAFGSCIQWNYSILERRPETALFPLLEEKKINFIARSPLYRGLLTERFLNCGAAAGYGRDDIRSTLDTALLEWVGLTARRIVDEAGADAHTISRFALSYVMSHPRVSCVIPGVSTAANLRSAVEAWKALAGQPPDAYRLPDDLDSHYPRY